MQLVDTRVLLTDGRVTEKLFWIRHTGKDLIYGDYSGRGHTSYHASGRYHFKSNQGEYVSLGDRAPLKDFKGVAWLRYSSFRISTEHFQDLSPMQIYDPSKKRARADSLLTIDSRVIPDQRQIVISFGLVEAGNGDAISRLVATHENGSGLVVNQLLLATAHTTWVWAMLSWSREVTIEQVTALHRFLYVTHTA